MAVFSGPKIPDDGLVFYIDAAHKKTISPLGNNSFNSAPQLIRNIVSPQDTINAFNGVHIGNLDYYTVFAIDFPEGNFGGTGTGAGRHGITAGLDVRSGGKLYSYSRALHFHVYNNDTNS